MYLYGGQKCQCVGQEDISQCIHRVDRNISVWDKKISLSVSIGWAEVSVCGTGGYLTVYL